MSRKLAEMASQVLARKRPRRGFLAKSAVVGSALAVAPKDFLTKPASAYARVCNCAGQRCNCSKLCCDGYTEFCCTIYGTNGCPPGSLYGGWWRVSGSKYCGGSNRYYMDCHNPCDGCRCGANGICSGRCNGTKCGCALGSCGNRKAGCTHFRYGQCNQHVKCVGPIICRVVTCTPPWRLEPSCTTSSRTDNFTRSHNRACLGKVKSPPVGELQQVAAGPGLVRAIGWAIDTDTTDPIDVQIHLNGKRVATISANQNRVDIGAAYRSYGEYHGFDVTMTTSPGATEICAYAVNRPEGLNPLLGCKRITVPAAQATGILENASVVEGGVAVTGWAVVPGEREPVEVDVLVDDVAVEQVKADVKRKDLAETLAGSGSRHGFDALVPVDTGASTVCATVNDPATGEVVHLGCLPVRPDSEPPFGEVEDIRGRKGRVRVTGWALDPDGRTARALITIDGVEAKRVKAKHPRPELVDVDPHLETGGGFDTRVPAATGNRSVCVYAVGSDGAVGPLLGCAEVFVASPDR